MGATAAVFVFSAAAWTAAFDSVGFGRRAATGALLAAAVASPHGPAGYVALAVALVLIAAGGRSRTGYAWLGLAAAAYLGAAGALARAPDQAFWMAVVGMAVSAGVLPLHVGAAALAERKPSALVELAGATFAAVVLHLRFAIPAASELADESAPALVAWGAAAALVGALLGLTRTTLRGLWTCSFTMHAGMTLSALGAAGRGHSAAALFVAVTFAVALGGFGAVVSALESRVGPVRLAGGGGRVKTMPALAAAFAVYAAAGIALPGTAGFAADDLLLHALWQELPVACAAMLAASATLAIGLLRGFVAVFLGPEPRVDSARDLGTAERVLVLLGIVVLVGLGLFPMILVPWAETLR